jgi:hypothetical protein
MVAPTPVKRPGHSAGIRPANYMVTWIVVRRGKQSLGVDTFVACFFLDEITAIKAGCRPCAACMPAEYSTVERLSAAPEVRGLESDAGRLGVRGGMRVRQQEPEREPLLVRIPLLGAIPIRVSRNML